jgi:propionyl-CoA carboxylase alpha chain
MERAIDDYAISGVETTLGFCRYVMGHQSFRSGKYDTHFVRDHFTPASLDGSDVDEAMAAALVAATLEQGRIPMPSKAAAGVAVRSPWKLIRG